MSRIGSVAPAPMTPNEAAKHLIGGALPKPDPELEQLIEKVDEAEAAQPNDSAHG